MQYALIFYDLQLILARMPHGPLAGKRVRVSLDGGRVRIRRRRRGRKTAKGRHGFRPRGVSHGCW